MATNKRKTTTAIVAVVTALVVLLGGTFAWSSISQTALNESVVDINPGGRLHDDFDGLNKDVYVENFGDTETGVAIFARIRLDEYMEIGQGAGLNKTDPTADRNVKVLDQNPDDANTPVINDVSTWETYIPGTNVEHLFDKNETVYTTYWDWTLGNADTDLKWYMPTFNKNKDSLTADINGTYAGTDPTDDNHYDDYETYAEGDTEPGTEVTDADSNTNEEADGVQSADVNLGYSTTDLTQPIDNYNVYLEDTTHEAAQLSSGAEVITMAQFLAPTASGGKGGEPGPYWVYDTDGWAYWAQPIEPGETTGLLLNGIGVNKVPDDNYYYGINVVGQFATADDWEIFDTSDITAGDSSDQMTADARTLMTNITTPKSIWALVTANADGTTQHLSILSSAEEYAVGDTYNGAEVLQVIKNYDYQGYTWGVYPWTDSPYRTTITSASVDNKVAPVSTAGWFAGLESVANPTGLENIDFSNVVTMETMFYGMGSMESIDVSNWDTSNVKNLHSMFHTCTNLKTITGLETWDVSNVESFRALVYNCGKLETVDLTGWDVTNARELSHIFMGDVALTSVGAIDQWDTSNAWSMRAMFNNCNSLNIDISGWDVSSVKNYDYFINNASLITPPADFVFAPPATTESGTT